MTLPFWASPWQAHDMHVACCQLARVSCHLVARPLGLVLLLLGAATE